MSKANLADYVLVMHDVQKVNWDGALTLGTCILVAGAVISPAISYLYKRFRVDNKRLWNVMLGTILTSTLYLLSITATVLLGFWTASILQRLGVEQGVIRPWTPDRMAPYTDLSKGDVRVIVPVTEKHPDQ